jgi:mannose-6-phosphate isomerase-like protein (cupin superfamily)
MKIKLYGILLATALASSAAFAQNADITVWPKGVPPAGTKVADFGDHSMQIGQRNASGRVEVHQAKTDILVIQTGTATLVTGGEVIDPTPTGPNELQGSSIKGGDSRQVGPGDVIEIPAGVPHQFLLAPGTQITYLAIKLIKHP